MPLSLPSTLVIFMMIRRPRPACRVPCQLPVTSFFSWAWARSRLPDTDNIKMSPAIHNSVFFMMQSPDWANRRCIAGAAVTAGSEVAQFYQRIVKIRDRSIRFGDLPPGLASAAAATHQLQDGEEDIDGVQIDGQGERDGGAAVSAGAD